MGIKSVVFALIFVAIASSCLATTLNNSAKESQNVGRFDGRTSAAEIVNQIVRYLVKGDLEGLYNYLSAIPELTVVLKWLEIRYPELFKRVCWLFNACGGHDLEIPAEVLRKILQYYAREDWIGLTNYLKTIEDNELLLLWIRYNLPKAWVHICREFDPARCPYFGSRLWHLTMTEGM